MKVEHHEPGDKTQYITLHKNYKVDQINTLPPIGKPDNSLNFLKKYIITKKPYINTITIYTDQYPNFPNSSIIIMRLLKCKFLWKMYERSIFLMATARIIGHPPRSEMFNREYDRE